MFVSRNTPQRKQVERRRQRTRDDRLALCLEGGALHVAQGATDGAIATSVPVPNQDALLVSRCARLINGAQQVSWLTYLRGAEWSPRSPLLPSDRT
jgi:hypothetical protein